ncbi:hypothetical protein [Stutzerimonas chloritidismutans]|uniref:hypothetical protein n=1 Tax=Stutzerimonas chloritidismutans TaxID=203192 RepID=UPI003F164CBB
MSAVNSPSNQKKREEAAEMLKRYRATAERIPGGWHVKGPRSDLRVSDLAYLLESDLR